MMKNIWKNALLLYTTLYTFATLLNSILYLADGIYEDPSGNWHEIDRAVIVLIGVIAFELCTKLKTKLVFLRFVIAYVPCQLLAFAYVWLSGLREPLAKSAYRDIWINFTGMFLVVCIVYFVVYFVRKTFSKRRNKVN